MFGITLFGFILLLIDDWWLAMQVNRLAMQVNIQGSGTPIGYVLRSASLVKISQTKNTNNLESQKSKTQSFIPLVKSQNKIYKNYVLNLK